MISIYPVRVKEFSHKVKNDGGNKIRNVSVQLRSSVRLVDYKIQYRINFNARHTQLLAKLEKVQNRLNRLAEVLEEAAIKYEKNDREIIKKIKELKGFDLGTLGKMNVLKDDILSLKNSLYAYLFGDDSTQLRQNASKILADFNDLSEDENVEKIKKMLGILKDRKDDLLSFPIALYLKHIRDYRVFALNESNLEKGYKVVTDGKPINSTIKKWMDSLNIPRDMEKVLSTTDFGSTYAFRRDGFLNIVKLNLKDQFKWLENVAELKNFKNLSNLTKANRFVDVANLIKDGYDLYTDFEKQKNEGKSIKEILTSDKYKEFYAEKIVDFGVNVATDGLSYAARMIPYAGIVIGAGIAVGMPMALEHYGGTEWLKTHLKEDILDQIL